MNNGDVAVSVQGLYKDFLLPHERKNSLKEWILHFKKPSYEKFHALKGVNFEVKRGEFFGIVGRNGSGKSTLLKTIGGIYQPTKGKIHINGTLTPFIELGIGFNPELTGRENVFLNGAILGLSRKEVRKLYDEIVAFAELERFMDQKLKNYSSGMQVRLAFSIAIRAHNDILLIDEVLAVGDAAFQRKCYEIFSDIKKSGKTVIFVTHDMGAIQQFCDRALMIQDSKVITIGEPRDVALRYQMANSAQAADGSAEVGELQRPKDPAIKILDLTLTANGKAIKNLSLTDDLEVNLKIDVRRPQEVQVTTFIVKADNTYLAGINCTKDIPRYIPEKGIHHLQCKIKAGQLIQGEYKIGAGIYTLDYVPDLIDIIDRGYSDVMPRFIVTDTSRYQNGQFYIQGKWSKVDNK